MEHIRVDGEAIAGNKINNNRFSKSASNRSLVKLKHPFLEKGEIIVRGTDGGQ